MGIFQQTTLMKAVLFVSVILLAANVNLASKFMSSKTRRLAFDCSNDSFGLWTVIAGWNAEHKAYCCKQGVKKACVAPEGSDGTWDCTSVVAPGVGPNAAEIRRWNAKKVAYCCDGTHYHLGGNACPKTRRLYHPSPKDPFNCHHGIMSQWSQQQKKWCCSHAGMGCPER